MSCSQREHAGQSTVASHGSNTSSQSTGSLFAILIQYGRSRSRSSPVIRSIMWKVGRPSSSSAPFSDIVPVRPKPTPTSFTWVPLLSLTLGQAAAGTLAPTASEQRDARRDPAADHESRDRRAHERSLAVAYELAAPVRDLRHLRAQVIDGEGQLMARLLDRGPDHLWAAGSACHYAFTSSPSGLRSLARTACSPLPRLRLSWSRSIFCASSSARVRLASSIASSGVGGEPFLNSRSATTPARIANRNSMPVTTANPAQLLSSQLKTSLKNQARPWKKVVIPKIMNTPAATATAAPLVSFETLSLTSALASSISSRTSREAFSETSATISPSDLPALSSGGNPLAVIAPIVSGSWRAQTRRRKRRPRRPRGARQTGRSRSPR